MASGNETIAVTGATGFIGSYLVNHIEADWRRLVRSHHSAIKRNDIIGDLHSQHDVDSLVEGVQTLVHLASVNAPRSSNRDFQFDIENNLLSSIRLLETFARKNPSGHIIYSSSGGAIYAPGDEKIPFREQDRLLPTSSYAIQKVAIEQYIHLLNSIYGVSATILRISNPYGVPLPVERAQGLIGVAFNCAIEGKKFPVIGSPQTVRDYIHLDDLVAVVKILLTTPRPSGVKTYNVGSSVGTSVGEILQKVQESTGKSLKLVTVKQDSHAPAWNVLDISLAKRELGWRPKISLYAGLSMMNSLIRKS